MTIPPDGDVFIMDNTGRSHRQKGRPEFPWRNLSLAGKLAFAYPLFFYHYGNKFIRKGAYERSWLFAFSVVLVK